MAKKERLDKILSNLGYGTRKEIKGKIKAGLVKVEGKIIKDSSLKVNPGDSLIEFNNKEIDYRKYIYLLMNKPQGVISATDDNYHKTVIDLIDNEFKAFEPFPVGRLDKDTEGLLLLTNDGKLAHNLLSPKKHIDKKYYVEVKGELTSKDEIAFKDGIDIGEKDITLPADLQIISSGKISTGYVTIREGKFHQVKRMFKELGKEVVYLKRVSMGELLLDPNLRLGEYRELTTKELEKLNK
ncbi:rRNA pseudouridine synthase [Clostridium sp. D2Q-11]|uniref:Pseudouridine synthase n=1 Tax=Anaeromonas frigoriresistens TaxID=2683708 RepID=A0A942Z6Q1_9FIRM|nr:pseudouridine synthase [Anaeromonas frigoriresistens]MBS4537817.1 rRNA pseudouridine synthase [Anaeromonas frigoriresistens]